MYPYTTTVNGEAPYPLYKLVSILHELQNLTRPNRHFSMLHKPFKFLHARSTNLSEFRHFSMLHKSFRVLGSNWGQISVSAFYHKAIICKQHWAACQTGLWLPQGSRTHSNNRCFLTSAAAKLNSNFHQFEGERVHIRVGRSRGTQQFHNSNM